MKKLIFSLIAIAASWFACGAENTLTYVGSIPRSGGGIRSWNIDLEFTLGDKCADLQAKYPNKKIGVVPQSDINIKVYQGDGDSGKLILDQKLFGRQGVLFDDKDTNIIPTGLSRYNLPLVKGEKYRVELQFEAVIADQTYKNGNYVTYEEISFEDEPLVLEFTGGDPLPAFTMQDYGEQIKGNNMSQNLSELRFTFDQQITLVKADGAKIFRCASISNYANNDVYETLDCTLSVENGNTLVVRSEAEPWKKGFYVLQIDAGAFRSTDFRTLVNERFIIETRGEKRQNIGVKVSPTAEMAKHPETIDNNVTIQFDLPTGIILRDAIYGLPFYDAETGEQVLYVSPSGYTYDKSIGKMNWDTKMYTYKLPGRKLYLDLDKLCDQSLFMKTGNENLNGLYPSEEDSKIYLDFPTVEELNLGYITLNTIYNDTPENVIAPFGRVDQLGKVYFVFNSMKFDNVEFMNLLSVSANKLLLYDTTGGEKKLVSETVCSIQSSTGNMATCYANISKKLYKGHTYQIVIPEQTIRSTQRRMNEYIYNKEITFDIAGNTEIEPLDEPVFNKDGNELKEIPFVYWRINDNPLELAEGAKVTETRRAITKDGMYAPAEVRITEFPITLTIDNTNNYIRVIMPQNDRGCYEFEDGYEYEYTLPAGCLKDVLVKERPFEGASGKILGVYGRKMAAITDIVPLRLEFDGETTVKLSAVKDWNVEVSGRNENWQITNVEANSTDLTCEDNKYTHTVADDNLIRVLISHAGDIKVLNAENPICKDGDKVCAELDGQNLTLYNTVPGTDINIHTASGLTAYSHTASDNTVTVTLPEGDYVVKTADNTLRVEIR